MIRWPALWSRIVPLLLAGNLLGFTAPAWAGRDIPPSRSEFGVPWSISVTPDGTAIDLSGSFSWAVPRNFLATLNRAPHVTTVRLNSPGGVVTAAVDVANIIRARGLNTYAERLCASACTVAFLAGVRREAAPGARIGFHQAYAREAARERLKPILRAAYVQAGLPLGFIDRALRTPPDRLWVPPHQELQAVGVLSATVTPDLPDRDEVVRDWMPAMLRLASARDATVLDAARTLVDVLEELQAASPDGCWGFMHSVATEVGLPLKPTTIAAMASVERHVDADAPEAVAVLPTLVGQIPLMPQLLEAALLDGQGPIVAALLPDGNHAAFCPAFRRLILAAATLPAATRQQALRSLLASG